MKTFAMTTEGIENACVEFDVATLRPTYRLLIGIPGASNAFAISRRLGLSESLIIRAKQLIQADHAQFEQVINQLEKEKMLYEQMQRNYGVNAITSENLAASATNAKTEMSLENSPETDSKEV